MKTVLTKDNVWVAGQVTIDGVIHIVKDGYVKCSASLNHRAWNITEGKVNCPECFPPKVQLKLF